MRKGITLIGVITSILCLWCPTYAIIWYVHPDSALSRIQTGLAYCGTGDTVLVAAGTYYESLFWPNTQGIDLTSESGPDTTIIDGYGSTRAIFISSVDSTTVISGFTIRNGAGSVSAGIHCNSCSPIISNNIITDNTSGEKGGGISCFDASPTITDNTIRSNTAGDRGGAIYCLESTPTIIGNTITLNTAEQNGGGIFCENSSPTIAHNIIIENTAVLIGGGITCWQSTPIIVGNTIKRNIACDHGGGIACWLSSPIIDSCIISSNHGDGVYCEFGSSPDIYYNNITYNAGYGVLNVDSSIVIDAENNWWGDASGPSGFGPGSGDSVSQWVDYDPWLQDSVEWPGVEDHKVEEPARVILSTNPNPFSKSVRIRFQVGSKQIAAGSIEIFDTAGRLVRRWDYPTMKQSDHITWNGTDHAGRNLPSGVYFIRLKADGFQVQEKLLLVR